MSAAALLARHLAASKALELAPDARWNAANDAEIDARDELRAHVLAQLGLTPEQLPLLSEALS